ncbi:MAG: hypothetical protein SH857_01075 [Chitinophagales bacterium]|nr:hypothetical protein [Chitinophagales bacterium]
MSEPPALVSQWADTSWLPVLATLNTTENKFTIDSANNYSLWALSSDTIQTQKALFYCEGFEDVEPADSTLRRSCVNTSDAFMNKYRLQTYYYPTPETPVKYINIAFVVRNRNDSTRNYSQSDTTHVQKLYDIFERMNYYLRVNERPSDPRTNVCGSCYIRDSRLRLQLDTIVFTYDTTTFRTYSTANGVGLGRIINIFFRGDASPCDDPGGRRIGNSLFMGNQHCSNQPLDAIAQNVLHEIFHIFEVNHVYQDETCTVIDTSCCSFAADTSCCNTTFTTWSGDDIGIVTDIDYLTDVFGNTGIHTWESYIYSACDSNAQCDPYLNKNDNCTNNLMGSRGKYISPMQMGRLHRNSMIEDERRFVCGYGTIPLRITTNETWDFTIKIYQDILVTTGNTLTIQCNVEMVPEANIIVERGAKLVIDGGVIINGVSHGCEGLWRGIVVFGNDTIQQPSGINIRNAATYQLNAADHGVVVIINNGRIENAEIGVQLGSRPPGSFNLPNSGGMIFADTAVFRNNKVAVRFELSLVRNKSKITNSTFETTELLADSDVLPEAFVQMLALKGHPYFRNNIFRNTATTLYNNWERGNGIESYGPFNVSGRRESLLNYENSLEQNEFENLVYGVSVYGNFAQGVNISRNIFANNRNSIFLSSADNAVVTLNAITVGFRKRLSASQFLTPFILKAAMATRWSKIPLSRMRSIFMAFMFIIREPLPMKSIRMNSTTFMLHCWAIRKIASCSSNATK